MRRNRLWLWLCEGLWSMVLNAPGIIEEAEILAIDISMVEVRPHRALPYLILGRL
jgi:hypothetical protein